MLNPLSLYRLARKSVSERQRPADFLHGQRDPQGYTSTFSPSTEPNSATSPAADGLAHQGEISAAIDADLQGANLAAPGSNPASQAAGALWSMSQDVPAADLWDGTDAIDLDDLQNYLTWDLDGIMMEMGGAAVPGALDIMPSY